MCFQGASGKKALLDTRTDVSSVVWTLIDKGKLAIISNRSKSKFRA